MSVTRTIKVELVAVCAVAAWEVSAVHGADVPFSEDERAALRWLDHVSGELPVEDEKEWWDIGGDQTGLFAKRYSIAFCGYAAAALGMRGGSDERATAGRILGNCISRMLKRDAWAYAMHRDYWGSKPWAADRKTALELWNEAAKRIGWDGLATAPDKLKGSTSCCEPVDVPPMATMTFLAAAARACDDSKAAERLERMIDRKLVRKDGMLYLSAGRDWRIGATANRIISLAEANGFRFRSMVR